MKIILSLLLAACAFNASAEIIVWKYAEKISKIGGGLSVKTSLTGYLVFDTATADLAFVQVEKVRGRFHVAFPDNYTIKTVSNGLGVSNTVFAFKSTGLGGYIAKGKNVPVEIGILNTFNAPKSLTFNGGDSYDRNGENFVEESKGKLTFDKTRTQAAQFNSRDFEQTIEDLRAGLVEIGYQQE